MQHTSDGACVVATVGSKVAGVPRRLSKGSTRRRKTTTLAVVLGHSKLQTDQKCSMSWFATEAARVPNGIKEVNWWCTWPEFLILAVSQCLRVYKRINARLLC